MKRMLLLLAALLIPSLAFAQKGLSIPTPDCEFGFTYAVVGGVITAQPFIGGTRVPPTQSGAVFAGYDNRSTACTSWNLVYQVDGPAAVSLELDFAPTSANTPGTWTIWPAAQIATGGTLPLTNATQASITAYSYRSWVSVILNSATGTGQVSGRVFGWRPGSGQDSASATVQVSSTLTGADAVANTGFNGLTSSAGTSPGLTGLLEFNGSTWDRYFYCPNTATFSVVSTVTQIVPISGTTKIRVCSATFFPSTSTAGSIDLVYGTGASCGTGTTTLTGAVTLPAAAVVSIPLSIPSTGPLITPAGQALCVRTVTSTVNGFLTWAQY